MANAIHPSAVVGKRARLGEGNEIGPGCVIEDGAALGSRNRLWMNVYVGPGTTIGDDNQLHMGAVIGHLPQDLAFAGATTFTKIGNRNTIREYVTIHRGTKEGTATTLGDDNFLMASAHLGHNCQVGSRTVFVNLATLAGYCTVEDGAVLSGMIVVHQFTRIGRLAMVSGLSAVNKDVPPFMLCGGRPAVIQGLNVVGMRRADLAPAAREDIKRAYRFLYREGLSVPHALEVIARDCRSPEAAAIVAFVKGSKRGISAGLPTPRLRQAGIGSDEAGEEETLLPKKPPQNPALTG
ncbi:MAG: acyl-[acyl-carrier-protein]--UDP-N-acetylglucosamine O-acyltransferase [Omnitrophica bacterium RIFCSPHIGHO2_02_FULL_63_14]|nr:MAG: acyl-[acyl-carrier-protein]--UDP-N-acetylglucosamine O-acyltransferase [Omnitrophica bacterium RIFCSPHIGHO2_02_FULL_63_14]